MWSQQARIDSHRYLDWLGSRHHRAGRSKVPENQLMAQSGELLWSPQTGSQYSTPSLPNRLRDHCPATGPRDSLQAPIAPSVEQSDSYSPFSGDRQVLGSSPSGGFIFCIRRKIFFGGGRVSVPFGFRFACIVLFGVACSSQIGSLGPSGHAWREQRLTAMHPCKAGIVEVDEASRGECIDRPALPRTARCSRVLSSGSCCCLTEIIYPAELQPAWPSHCVNSACSMSQACPKHFCCAIRVDLDRPVGIL